METPLSWKATVPVGDGMPPGAATGAGTTCAVRTSAWPETAGEGAAVIVVVVGLPTTTWPMVNCKAVVGIWATMACDPASSADVVNTACPFCTVAMPSGVVPSEKATGMPFNDEPTRPMIAEETAAVKVTGSPATEGFWLLVSVTKAGKGGDTVWAIELEPPPKFVSPL